MLNSAFRGGNQILGYLIVAAILLGGLGIAFFEEPSDAELITGVWGVDLALSILLILGSAILLNSHLSQQKFIAIGNIVPGTFLIMFLSGLDHPADHLKTFLSVFLFIFLIRKMISLHNASNNYIPVFELGLILGLIMVISPQFSGLFLLYLIGLTLVKSFTWRDFIIPPLGVGFVFLTKTMYLFFTDQPIDVSSFIDLDFSRPSVNAELNLNQIVLTAITAIEFLFISKLFGVIEKKNIRVRVHYWLWIWSSILFLFSMLFLQTPINKVELILLMGLPASVFANVFFEDNLKTWMKDAVLVALMIGVLYLRVSKLV